MLSALPIFTPSHRREASARLMLSMHGFEMAVSKVLLGYRQSVIAWLSIPFRSCQVATLGASTISKSTAALTDAASGAMRRYHDVVWCCLASCILTLGVL